MASGTFFSPTDMTDKDIATIRDVKGKLDMIESHESDMTERQINHLLTAITFDISSMDIRRTGFEPKFK